MFRADELKNFQLDNKNIYSNNTSGDGENFVNDELVEEASDDGEEFRAIDSSSNHLIPDPTRSYYNTG